MSNENLPLTSSPSVLSTLLVELKLNAIAIQKARSLHRKVHAHMCAHSCVSNGKRNPPSQAKLDNQHEAGDTTNFN